MGLRKRLSRSHLNISKQLRCGKVLNIQYVRNKKCPVPLLTKNTYLTNIFFKLRVTLKSSSCFLFFLSFVGMGGGRGTFGIGTKIVFDNFNTHAELHNNVMRFVSNFGMLAELLFISVL